MLWLTFGACGAALCISLSLNGLLNFLENNDTSDLQLAYSFLLAFGIIYMVFTCLNREVLLHYIKSYTLLSRERLQRLR